MVKMATSLFNSGLERFTYSLPERAVQAVATLAFAAAHIAAFSLFWSWQPQIVAAALVSWVSHNLTLTRWAILLALGALDKVWLFWLVLGGSAIDRVLEKHAPTLRHYAWFLFKVRGQLSVPSTPLFPYPDWTHPSRSSV